MYRPLLLSVLASAVSTAYAYTLQNVTIGSANSKIEYYPPCVEANPRSCPGAWYKVYDDRFLNGSAMQCGDATDYFGGVEPFFHYTFQGAAMRMYQWMNTSTATQMQMFDNSKSPFQNLTNQYQGQLTGELVPVLTWALTGLDPLKTHTINIQHFPTPDRATQITFDYMIIEQTILEPGDIVKKKSKVGPIVGGIIGGLLLLVALIFGFILIRNQRRRKANAAGSKGRYNWQATVEPTPNTIKFVDPSSEIEASERIAREGRLEEEAEKQGKLGGVV